MRDTDFYLLTIVFAMSVSRWRPNYVLYNKNIRYNAGTFGAEEVLKRKDSQSDSRSFEERI